MTQSRGINVRGRSAMRRGIVVIWQHCDMNASVRWRRTSGLQLTPIAGMTSADTSAASFAPSFVESKGRSLWRFVAPFVVAVALLSALLTFVVLTGLTRIEPTRDVVISFMLINAAIILLLVGIIVRELWQVVQARRRGRAAARLHVQIVGLFSVIAVLPAVLVAIVANVTIDRGFDRLFSGPTRERDPELADRRAGLSVRARGTHSRRHHRNGQRYFARQATIRSGSRHVSRASDGKCRLAQPAGRDADRQGQQDPGDGTDRHQARPLPRRRRNSSATSRKPNPRSRYSPKAIMSRR